MKIVGWCVLFKVGEYVCSASVDTEEEAEDLASQVQDAQITAVYDVRWVFTDDKPRCTCRGMDEAPGCTRD